MGKTETNKAAQDAYHEARSVGHTKEEARGLRDNWYVTTPSSGRSYSDDDDYSSYSSEPYDQDCSDD